MNAANGKTVLVTGGGAGIGRAVVDRFIAEGASVGVLERSAAHVQDLAAAHGDRVCAVQGDATSRADNERAVAETVTAFGGVDVLVACVGVFDYFASIVDVPSEIVEEAFDELYGTNVKGMVLAVKAALPQLLARDGAIVLTASNAAFNTAGGGFLYTSSKFAVRGLVEQLAYELAPKIRVNAVAPGGTPSDLPGLESLGQEGLRLRDVPGIESLISGSNPLGVVCAPEDHAGAYVYLASNEQARTVTGTVLRSDGGLGVRGLAQAGGLTDTTTPVPA